MGAVESGERLGGFLQGVRGGDTGLRDQHFVRGVVVIGSIVAGSLLEDEAHFSWQRLVLGGFGA